MTKFVTSEAKLPSDEKPLVFGTLGSYSGRKRLVDLILAVDLVSKELGPQTPLFIWYGENRDPEIGAVYDEFATATRMIQERKLERFFDLRGPTTTPEEALRHVDCVCLASEEEGMPNSICEAFACGKPVVATLVGDVPYLVTEGITGFLAEPRNPPSLAAALLKMVRLEGRKRIEMGRSARHYAETNFSVEVFCDQYITLIESLSQKDRG